MLVNKHISEAGNIAVVKWRDNNISAHIKYSLFDRS